MADGSGTTTPAPPSEPPSRFTSYHEIRATHSPPPRKVSRAFRRAPFQIRLESLSGRGTRIMLYVTYITLAVALILTATQKLELDKTLRVLPGPYCAAGTTAAPGQDAGCTFDEPHSNSTAWIGTVYGISKFSSLQAVTLEFENVNITHKWQPNKIPITVSISASEEDNADLVPLFNSSADGAIVCTPSDDNAGCTPLSLLLNQGDIGVGFTSYQVQVTYSNFDILQVPATLSYYLWFEEPSFQVGTMILRGILLCVTVVALFWYLCAHNRVRDGSPHTAACCSQTLQYHSRMLPQQRWVTLLLIELLCWQNPLYMAVQLQSDPSPSLRLASQFLESFAVAGMLLFWLMMMDGLRSQHHSWKYFYMPKLLFHGALLIIVLSLGVMRQPQVSAAASLGLRDAIGAMDIIYVILLFLWLFWFIYATLNTRSLLRTLPYMPFRFQQLSFRVMLFQQIVLVAFVLIVNAIPLLTFFVNFIRLGGSVYSTGGIGFSMLLSALTRESQPVGELLLLSVYGYLVAFMYLPPSRQTFQSSSGFSYNLLSESRNDAEFDLDLCCWLFDLAWHAYYDPRGVVTESSFGSMDVPHHFIVDAFVSNATTDIQAYVLRKGPRVVVTFRGTNSRKNLNTDLNFQRTNVEFTQHTLVSRIPGVRLVLPQVHQGFAHAYESIREPLADQVLQALLRAGPHCRLYLTGHSLGGALSTLAAVDLAPLVKETKHLYTAAQRSLFSRRFANNAIVRVAHTVFDAVVGIADAVRNRTQAPVESPSSPRVDSVGSVQTPLLASSRGEPLLIPPLTLSSTLSQGSDGESKSDTDGGPERALSGESRAVPAPGGYTLLVRATGGGQMPLGLDLATQDTHMTVDKFPMPIGGTFVRVTEAMPAVEGESKAGAGAMGPAVVTASVEDELFNQKEEDDQGVGVEPDDTLEAESTPGSMDVVLYNFGSPRVGNHTFANIFNDAVKHAFRVVFEGDFVAGIPKMLWMFKHVGHSVEIDAAGNTIVDPSFVEQQFRVRTKRRFGSHSMYAYRNGLRCCRDLEGHAPGESYGPILHRDAAHASTAALHPDTAAQLSRISAV